MKRLWIVVPLALAATGCVLSVERVHLSAFKRDVRDAVRHAQDQGLLAERLLCGGIDDATAEAVLRANGLSADDARKVVMLAEATKRCNTPSK